MTSPYTLSVLICTYNRHNLLRQALQTLVKGTDERPDQVVIVNGGDHKADRVVETFKRQGIDIYLVKTVNKNLAASRNVGLPHCTGDIIAMTDDDAEVFPDWVSRMKRAHQEHPEAGAVGGPVIGTNTGSLVSRVADLITFPTWPKARYVRTLPGVNISYKREMVERLGQQDESLFRGEDVDYNWRLQKLGSKIYFDPDIKVYHHHRPTLRALLDQFYMYGRAYYLVRRKWPDMYCIYPHGIRGPRDAAKAMNFVAGLFYQPLLGAWQLSGWRNRVKAVPILIAADFAWKSGMITQRIRSEAYSITPA